jgi:uncharacterized protein (TIGR02246 family)
MRASPWRRSLLGVLCLSVLFAGTAGPADRPEAVVDGFVRAWNAHDMKAFGELFADDADFVNVAGMWWKGRAEIQRKHEESHATRLKGTTLAASGTSTRLLRRDVAVLHFSWELTGEVDPDGKPLAPRRGIMTIVASGHGSKWQIVAAQNTNAMPPP